MPIEHEANARTSGMEPGAQADVLQPRIDRTPAKVVTRALVLCQRGLCACAVIGLIVVAALPAFAQTPLATEGSIKAAFLYRFLDFVEWPDSLSSQPFTIAVAYADPVADELKILCNGRTVHDRKIVVRIMARGEGLEGTHLLFVGKGAATHTPALIAAATAMQSILTVTEIEQGLASGSIINFIVVDGRVRFAVSLPAARKAGITLSSKMLSVAQFVETDAK